MPKVLDKCVNDLMAKGKSRHSAYAICSTTTGYKRKKGGGWVKRKESSKKK